jgi:DNA mismatch endonuclease, patch repair protein
MFGSLTRSELMRRIRSENTGPEVALFRALRRRKVHHKRHDRLRPGTPDLSFPSRRLAVFVHGEFWHGRGNVPKTNRAFWKAKFERNQRRDRRVRRRLNAMGWSVMVLWAEPVLKNPDAAAAKVLSRLSSSNPL